MMMRASEVGREGGDRIRRIRRRRRCVAEDRGSFAEHLPGRAGVRVPRRPAHIWLIVRKPRTRLTLPRYSP